MKTLITTATALIFATVFSGCIVKTIGVNTVSSYEKRYDPKTEIVINGEKVEIPEGKSVWVLRSDTLEVLLSTAADKYVSKIK